MAEPGKPGLSVAEIFFNSIVQCASDSHFRNLRVFDAGPLWKSLGFTCSECDEPTVAEWRCEKCSRLLCGGHVMSQCPALVVASASKDGSGAGSLGDAPRQDSQARDLGEAEATTSAEPTTGTRILRAIEDQERFMLWLAQDGLMPRRVRDEMIAKAEELRRIHADLTCPTCGELLIVADPHFHQEGPARG